MAFGLTFPTLVDSFVFLEDGPRRLGLEVSVFLLLFVPVALLKFPLRENKDLLDILFFKVFFSS